jgi:flagellar assembly protein FliH
MGLIKSENTPVSISPFSMADVERHAKAMLMRAKTQAEEILEEAHREAVAVRESARIDGHTLGKQEGLVAGMEEGKKAGHQQALNENRTQLTNLVKSLTAAMTDIDAHRRKIKADAVQDVIELAIAIATRVTKQQGAADPSVAKANVAEAMNLVTHAGDVRIGVHPQQKASLQQELPALKMQWPGLSHVELVEDATLAPCGCRIFTRGGMVDADLDVQIARVVADLLPTRSGGME